MTVKARKRMPTPEHERPPKCETATEAELRQGGLWDSYFATRPGSPQALQALAVLTGRAVR